MKQRRRAGSLPASAPRKTAARRALLPWVRLRPGPMAAGWQTAFDSARRASPAGKGTVHTSAPRSVPLAPPSLSSSYVRAPPPSLGLLPRLGSRASESRVTPVPGTDGPSHLHDSMSPVGLFPAGLRRRRGLTDQPDPSSQHCLNTAPVAARHVGRARTHARAWGRHCTERDSDPPAPPRPPRGGAAGGYTTHI